jgi:hypothetical protein
MRHNPVLSETDAFRLTIAVTGFVVVSVVVGWLTSPVVGVIVFVAVGLFALVVYMCVPESDRRRPLHKAAHERHPHGPPPGSRHVIVVANQSLAGDELSAHIRGADRGTVEVDVLAPVLVSRAHLAYTDIDKELREASERLSRSLAWAREQGFPARGTIGDPSSRTALEDELRDFGADKVIVASGRRESGQWQERTELERLRDELDVPVVHVMLD